MAYWASILVLILGIGQLTSFSTPFLIKCAVILTTSLLFLSKSKSSLRPYALVLVILLALLQTFTTRVSEVYNFTPLEIEDHLTRVHLYRPHSILLARLSESLLHPLWFDQLKTNFYDSLDFLDIFTTYFFPGYFIFFGLGLIHQLVHPRRFAILISGICLATFTLISPHGLYGPFLLYPLIIYLATDFYAFS